MPFARLYIQRLKSCQDLNFSGELGGVRGQEKSKCGTSLPERREKKKILEIIN